MKWVHKKFQLNGQSFSTNEELLAFAKRISNALNNFFFEWLSDDEFVIAKTSGSTGKPKNIKLSKQHMINSAFATGSFFELKEETKALCCLPIDFIAGKMMLVRAMTLGWHLDVVESTGNPLENLDKEYEFSAMVPLQVYNSLEKLELVSKLIVGGGVVSSELQTRLETVSTEVYATYGMTETITHIAVKRLNHTPWNSYKLLPNITIAVDHRDCLIITAPKVSEDKIITNDVVEIISESEFQWKGRYDNVINSGGVKLYPEEIERKLSNHITNRFFVAGVPDDRLGEKLLLVIEGDSFTIDERIFSSLNRYEKPKQIHFVAQFSETQTGKIQRKETLKRLF